VRIDAARKSERIPAIKNLLGLVCCKVGRETFDLPVLDCDVETIDGTLLRPYNAHVFYDEIERFRHALPQL
jgi:hypothetical protein